MTKLHSIQQIAVFFASACLGAFVVGPAAVSLAGNTQIWMPIATGTVSIVSTPTVVFPSTMSSASSQSVTVSPGLFTVEDLGGKYEGYYVTVSSSDLVNGATTVDNANVMVTVTGATVTTLAGNPNAAVLVPATAGEVGTGYVNLDSPRLLLARTWAGEGILGRYGVSPTFRVTLPAYAPAGSYAGTLTFTLVENSTISCLVGQVIPCVIP